MSEGDEERSDSPAEGSDRPDARQTDAPEGTGEESPEPGSTDETDAPEETGDGVADTGSEDTDGAVPEASEPAEESGQPGADGDDADGDDADEADVADEDDEGLSIQGPEAFSADADDADDAADTDDTADTDEAPAPPPGTPDPEQFEDTELFDDGAGDDAAIASDGTTLDADDVEPAAASDGGTVTGDSTNIGGDTPHIDDIDEFEEDDDWLRDGPEYDEEMPLADHIEEMVRRLLVVVVVMAVVSVPMFLFADRLINFIWNSILGAAGSQADPHVYSPLALILARLKTATLVGFVFGLPVFVYETYLFMRPGLYPQERRYYLAAVPTSLILAAIGVSFAFFLVLPGIFIYFLYYSQDVAFIAFGLSDTYGLMLLLMGFFAVIFQIPLFIMLAIMMGLTTRKWLADRRLYFWGAFLGIAFLFSPDPTGMAPIIVALTMVVLFEGTLLILRWTGRGKRAVTRR